MNRFKYVECVVFSMPKPRKPVKRKARLVDERKGERRRVPQKGKVFVDASGRRVVGMFLEDAERLREPLPPELLLRENAGERVPHPVVTFVDRRSGKDRRVKDLGRKARGKVRKKKKASPKTKPPTKPVKAKTKPSVKPTKPIRRVRRKTVDKTRG
jgi:hypothetical protein